eukprot:scaffold354789_cov47-Prasinocladus_malaysianus.AAC.1
MAVWAQRHLAQLWQTEALLPDDQTAAMAHVRLPGVYFKSDADALSDLLKKRHRIHVMFFGLPMLGSPEGRTAYWVRPCFQVYITHEDVEALGQAVLECLDLLPAFKAAQLWRKNLQSHRSSHNLTSTAAVSITCGASTCMPAAHRPV